MSLKIEKPTLLLNTSITRRNIHQMAEKARCNEVRFRPHFKTHQSAIIGEWFRAEGVTAITVSSVSMAEYFAAHGWQDITIAFPLNWLEIERINRLAAQITLNLVIESVETVAFLQENLVAGINVWLKIDTGYHRTGILWDDLSRAVAVGRAVAASGKMKLCGLLSHAGHSYKAKSTGQIRAIYSETVLRQQAVRNALQKAGLANLALSIGDTPCCTLVENLSAVDEIRPGNFVFHDGMQVDLGVCRWQDVAVAVACPVVAKHPAQGKLILYGGAVHLSKDFIRDNNGNPVYGWVALPAEQGWGVPLEGAYVASLSQEHGVVRAPAEVLEQIAIGTVVMVLPVHSCLAVDLLRKYLTLEGDTIHIGRYDMSEAPA